MRQMVSFHFRCDVSRLYVDGDVKGRGVREVCGKVDG
jgi:hypothetical protein